MNNDIERCLEIIGKIEARASGTSRGVRISIENIRDLTEIFKQLDEQDRLLVRDCISGKTGLVLIDYSVDAAEEAINTKDENWLTVAILTHVIEDFRYDYRENILRLYLIEYAAWKLDADMIVILDTLKNITSPDSYSRLESFFEDKLGERALKFSGLKVNIEDGKTKFVPD
jgi:hypothetical protein